MATRQLCTHAVWRGVSLSPATSSFEGTIRAKELEALSSAAEAATGADTPCDDDADNRPRLRWSGRDWAQAAPQLP